MITNSLRLLFISILTTTMNTSEVIIKPSCLCKVPLGTDQKHGNICKNFVRVVVFARKHLTVKKSKCDCTPSYEQKNDGSYGVCEHDWSCFKTEKCFCGARLDEFGSGEHGHACTYLIKILLYANKVSSDPVYTIRFLLLVADCFTDKSK